jgi:L-fucose mutarotase
MLSGRLLHPQILAALAGAGHGAKVLIAAANFPTTPRSGRNAAAVSLALAPGLVTCTDVLSVVVTATVFERAAVISPPDGQAESEPAAWSEYRGVFASIGAPLALEPLSGDRFMAETLSPDLALAVATGDQRLYTSILLTVGVVRPS